MPLSKTISKESAPDKVLAFTPKPIERDLSKSAEEFLAKKDEASRFKLSELVANQSGIAERERQQMEQRAELIALKKVQEIQEPAYKQAYDLGMEEGKAKAYEDHSKEINERLSKLDELIASVGKIKMDMLLQNEAQLVKSIYRLAGLIAKFEIAGHDDRIVGILKESIEHAQSEESILVKLSKEDFEFLEKIKENSKKELDFLKKVKLEVVPEISPGGCIIETNYGTIDASLEERIDNLWKAIVSKTAKPKEMFES